MPKLIKVGWQLVDKVIAVIIIVFVLLDHRA